jgi:hypothetical protein
MAKKKEAQEQPEGALVEAAKSIGEAAGKIAVAVGVTPSTPPAKPKIPKLAKKNKSRLPRRQKKAAQKVANAKAANAKSPRAAR